jgi:hypothetical protein
MGRKIWEERRHDQKQYGSVEKQVSRPGHRLPARRGEHLACRFPRDSGKMPACPTAKMAVLQSLTAFQQSQTISKRSF